MSDSLTALRAADPARQMDFEVLEATAVFDELRAAIVSGQFVADDALGTNPKSHRGGDRPETVPLGEYVPNPGSIRSPGTKTSGGRPPGTRGLLRD